jgi:TRAP-type C4-dicarboxylate transport system permease large subunit
MTIRKSTWIVKVSCAALAAGALSLLVAALALSLGLDIPHLYIVFVVFAGIRMITPPICVGIYTAAGVVKASSDRAFREVALFVDVGIIFGMLIIAFPQATIWLPNLLN